MSPPSCTRAYAGPVGEPSQRQFHAKGSPLRSLAILLLAGLAVLSAAGARRQGNDTGRDTVIYFDLARMSAANKRYARDTAIALVDAMKSGDRIAVAALGLQGRPESVLPFTGNTSLLLRTIAGMIDWPSPKPTEDHGLSEITQVCVDFFPGATRGDIWNISISNETPSVALRRTLGAAGCTHGVKVGYIFVDGIKQKYEGH